VLVNAAAVPARMVHVLHNSEQMASCIAVLDTGTCVVADSSFDLLMQKMRGFYAVRKNLRVESRGQRYKLVDFIVKVGSVVLGQTTSFRGVLVEVTLRAIFSVRRECHTSSIYHRLTEVNVKVWTLVIAPLT